MLRQSEPHGAEHSTLRDRHKTVSEMYLGLEETRFIERNMKIEVIWTGTTCFDSASVACDMRTEIGWKAGMEKFVDNYCGFKMYPVLDWEPV